MSKINVDQIDAQIRKLEELKRFMSDPATAPMIEQLISANGGSSASIPRTAQREAPRANQRTQRGELLAAVEAACKAAPDRFTAKHVIDRLESQGFVLQAQDKSIAVYSALKRLVKHQVIQIVSLGTGKRPSVYSLINRFPRTGEVKGTAA